MLFSPQRGPFGYDDDDDEDHCMLLIASMEDTLYIYIYCSTKLARILRCFQYFFNKHADAVHGRCSSPTTTAAAPQHGGHRRRCCRAETCTKLPRMLLMMLMMMMGNVDLWILVIVFEIVRRCQCVCVALYFLRLLTTTLLHLIECIRVLIVTFRIQSLSVYA